MSMDGRGRLGPIKDFFGLGAKPEGLGTGGQPSKKRNKFEFELKYLGLEASYDMHDYGKITVKVKAEMGSGIDDFYKIEGARCEGKYSLGF